MNEINLSLFGARLKEARKTLNLSQSEAADLTGVTREHWGRCERGLGIPGGEVLAALANAGADVLYILTGTRTATHAALSQVRTATELASKLRGSTQDKAALAETAFHQLQQPLPADEQMWLDCYREWDAPIKKRELRRAMGLAVTGPDQTESPPHMGNNNQVNSAPGAVQIKGTGNFVMPRTKK